MVMSKVALPSALMHANHPLNRSPIIPAELSWRGATPISARYGDVYFSADHGPAESQHVFIEGSALPQRCQALRSGQCLTLGELGFGTGLNLLLAAQCFLREAPADSFLHYHSVELHPLSKGDLQRALQHWPDLQPLAAVLLDEYPPPINGHHRFRLHPRIEVTLMWGAAESCWQDSQACVDVWFLDGFAPARNPQMWTAALCQTLAEHSAAGATLASFSVAAAVREHLTAAGFVVERRPGFGRKRHALAGHWPGVAAPAMRRTGHALVTGAGIAGATTARALAEHGWQVTVIEAEGIAHGASGNLAGVIYSTPSPHLHAQNLFYQGALWRALRWLHRHDFQTHQLNDVILHLVEPRRRRNTLHAADSGAWPEEQLVIDTPHQARLIGAGYIQPVLWCQHLLDHPNITRICARVTGYQPGHDGVSVTAGDHTYVGDALILCTAETTLHLPGLEGLPLRAMRGQVSHCRATPKSQHWTQATCHRGYLTPAIDGLHCIGATFDLHGQRHGTHPDDDADNLSQLHASLPEAWQALGGDAIAVVGQRAAYRCQSPDRLPLCGAIPGQAGIYLNVAHGSRGLTHTPWCADALADQLTGLGSGGESEVVAALCPSRYAKHLAVHCAS
jgi:tRNA 5-methylaminomethyl-2-thiouridine biosynthesis bifunctional protein